MPALATVNDKYCVFLTCVLSVVHNCLSLLKLLSPCFKHLHLPFRLRHILLSRVLLGRQSHFPKLFRNFASRFSRLGRGCHVGLRKYSFRELDGKFAALGLSLIIAAVTQDLTSRELRSLLRDRRCAQSIYHRLRHCGVWKPFEQFGLPLLPV